MEKFYYIGIDGEMSGNNLETSALIQVGFAMLNPKLDYFYKSIQPIGDYSWDKEAERVHKITRESLSSFEKPFDVDEESYQWLRGRGVIRKNIEHNIAVGWNVGSFDLIFLRRYLPKTYSLLSFRSVDLNSICHALDGKNSLSMLDWKNKSKEYATMMFEERGELKAHHAGWDAIMAIYAYQYLKKEISY